MALSWTRPARAVLLLAALLAPAGVAAQPVGIPPELLQPRRERPEGAIQFCLNPGSPVRDFDRAVGQAIADALLTEASFIEIVADYRVRLDYLVPLDDEELYIHLYTQCDALLGFAYSATTLRDWLTITRPYYETRFVLLASDPGIASLGALPDGARIGARIGSLADTLMVRYLAAQSGRPFVRTPYIDNAILLERIADGTVAAGFVWEPAYRAARAGDVITADLAEAAPAPLREPVQSFGILLLSADSYLRVLLDEAIGALTADGTIAGLLETTGTPGRPAQP